MSKNILEISQLYHQFSDFKVLHDVHFSLRKNEIVSLIGPSGCGKTVLLKLILGLIAVQQGKIQKNKIAMSVAFQDALLFPWLTIKENIQFCAQGRPVENTDRLLNLAYLTQYQNLRPKQISGGMRQKVNVLRSFVNQSELVLMDEPFTSLDSIQRAELQDLTMQMKQNFASTVLFVTHDIDEALMISDRILLMSKTPGKVMFEIDVPFTKSSISKQIIGAERRIQIKAEPAYAKLYQQIYNFLKQEIQQHV